MKQIFLNAVRALTRKVSVTYNNGAVNNLRRSEPSVEHRKMAEAQKQWKNSISELSKGFVRPSKVNIVELSQVPLENLTKVELEELARAYYQGVPDVEKNFHKAFAAWEKAAALGSIEAKYSKAMCLRQGVGVEQNFELAFQELLSLAEEHNYNLAHYSVALMFQNGEGVERDETRAFKHFDLAALGGVPPALHNLGNCYASGRGVPQSDQIALRYYEAAAETGDPFSKFTLGTWLYTGRGTGAPDRVRSFQLQLEAANEGHPIAMFNIGTIYMAGEAEVVPKDLEKAREWFEKAASANVAEAAVNLGNMYREGYGVEKDVRKAMSIFSRFADRNEVCRGLVEDLQKQIDSQSQK